MVDRLVTFQSQTYVQALNGEVGEGQFQCTLVSGEPIQTNVTYRPLQDFANCSLVGVTVCPQGGEKGKMNSVVGSIIYDLRIEKL